MVALIIPNANTLEIFNKKAIRFADSFYFLLYYILLYIHYI